MNYELHTFLMTRKGNRQFLKLFVLVLNFKSMVVKTIKDLYLQDEINAVKSESRGPRRRRDSPASTIALGDQGSRDTSAMRALLSKH